MARKLRVEYPDAIYHACKYFADNTPVAGQQFDKTGHDLHAVSVYYGDQQAGIAGDILARVKVTQTH